VLVLHFVPRAQQRWQRIFLFFFKEGVFSDGLSLARFIPAPLVLILG